jgi:hypothetical protein
LLGGARLASAQPAGSEAEAQALFDQAKALMQSNRIAEACNAFEASDHRAPAVSTMLNAGACREKNNQLATAWGEFREAERRTRDAADDTGKKLHKVAVDHAAKLEPRLSFITVQVAEADRVPGLEVLRNGAAVDAGAWNLKLPIDGGRYTIVARAPGRESFTTTFTLAAERELKAVAIPHLVDAAPRQVATPAPAPKPPTVTPPPAQPAVTTPTPSAPRPAPAIATTPAPAQPPPAQPTVATAPPQPQLERAAAPPALPAVTVDPAGESPTAPVPSPEGEHHNYAPYAVASGAALLLVGAAAMELVSEGTDADANNEQLLPGSRPGLRDTANTQRFVAEGLLAGGLATAGVATWMFLRNRHESRPTGVAVQPVASTQAIGLQVGGSW